MLLTARQIVRCIVIVVNPFFVNFVRPGGEKVQKGIPLPTRSYANRSIAQIGVIFNMLRKGLPYLIVTYV